MRWIWSLPNVECKRSPLKKEPKPEPQQEPEQDTLLDDSLPYQGNTSHIKEQTKKYLTEFDVNRNMIQTHQNPFLKTDYLKDLENEDRFLRPKNSSI